MSNGNDGIDAELNEFRHEYKPTSNVFAGPEVLKDGTYALEIAGAFLDRSQSADGSTGNPLFRLVLKVLSGEMAGMTFDRTSWLTSQDNVDRLGGDLDRLNLRWDGSGASLRGLIPKLVGRRFAGKKRSSPKKDNMGNPKPGEFWHNLDVVSPLTGPTATVPATRPAAAGSTPSMFGAAPQPHHTTGEDIPF